MSIWTEKVIEKSNGHDENAQPDNHQKTNICISSKGKDIHKHCGDSEGLFTDTDSDWSSSYIDRN